MAEAGRVLLAVALAGAIGGCVAALAACATGRHLPYRVARVASWVTAAAMTSATLVLARAFAVGDYSIVAVVDHSREALGLWGRVMGLWGGMAGSLLLFTTLTAIFAAVAVGRRTHPVAIVVAEGVVAALILIGWRWADPFATLEIPALDGAGLTPILEHWAMRVHPPMVYAGMTVLVVPAVRTLGALAHGRLDDDWWRSVRPWLVASWALLASGMLLGAMWAYVELGWGGYWAWDPVENAALLPWLAVTLALHTGPGHRARLSGPAVVAPFVVALLGVTLTRSGATSSVHAFAEARDIGLALTALLVVVALVASVLVVRASGAVSGRVRGSDRVQLAARVVVGAVFVVVVAGTVYPVFRGWLGGDRLAIQGQYFSGMVAPLVVLGLIGLIARGRWPSLLASASVAGTALVLVGVGWGRPFPVLLAALAAGALAAGLRELVRRRRPAELAHAGLAVLLIGVAGTATGARAAATIEVGEAIDLGGHEVVLRSIGTEQGPTAASTAVVARVTIDGHDRSASLVAHPERGVLLAESTLRSTPFADVQVILRNAGEDAALLVVHVAPFQQLVWIGGVLMVLGGVASGLAGSQPPSGPRRRALLASSSESSVEAGASGAGAGAGSGGRGGPGSGVGGEGPDRSAAGGSEARPGGGGPAEGRAPGRDDAVG